MQRATLCAVLVMMFGLSVAPLAAQESKGQVPASSQPAAVYRVQFTFAELRDGKRVNSRAYEMLARSGELNKLRAGARVPVGEGPGPANFQYIDVGMSIDCGVKEVAGGVELHIIADSSNFTNPEAQKDVPTSHVIIQQMRSQVDTLVTPGKPTLVSSMDDPSSNRRYQLEVTATKVK